MQLRKFLKTYDSLLASAAGFIAVYVVYTSYSGVGISPDSIMYASTAQNIAQHGSLLTFNGGPIVFFPIFYPVFLGIILFITRINTVAAAPVINSLLFAGVIFMSGLIVTKFKTYSGIYKWLILIAVALSPALLEIYTYLWSETLFIFITLVFVLAFWQYLQKRTLKALIIAAIVAALGCLTRYAGITLVGAGCLLLLFDKQLVIRKKIKYVLIFGSVSVSLLVGNLILNRLTSGLSTGTREESLTSLSKNLYYFGTVMCDWMGLPQTFYPYAVLISCIILFSITGLLAWRAYKGRINSCESIIIAFAVVYGWFIPVFASVSRFEPLNSRLLSPLFIPLLIGITCWAPGILKGKKLKNQLLIAIPFVAIMLFSDYSIVMTDYQRWYDENDYGVPGYSDDDWNKSQFIMFLKTHKDIYKPGVPRYTDADEATYFFAGTTATLVPHKYFPNTVKQFFTVKHYYLIWFSTLNNWELVGLHDILKHGTLKKLYGFPDGAVYEYTAK
jgi:hypothetical protein